MSNDLMLITYFILAFKIGLKSDLRMKLEEASHLTKEQKPLKFCFPERFTPLEIPAGH